MLFANLENALISLIHTLPLEVFVLIASFVEEVVAPIPSPTVMVLAGSFAKIQAYTPYSLILLALIGAVGKTIGGYVVYVLSQKGSGFLVTKFGSFFNVTPAQIEKFGAHLGHGARDYVVLTIFRALPFVPSVVVSVGSGILKVPRMLFLVSTFLGTIVRDSIYLYAGFMGTKLLTSLIEHTTALESVVQGFVVIVIILFVGRVLYLKLRK